MKKRIFSLILSLCMVFTICLPVMAATGYYENTTVPSYTYVTGKTHSQCEETGKNIIWLSYTYQYASSQSNTMKNHTVNYISKLLDEGFVQVGKDSGSYYLIYQYRKNDVTVILGYNLNAMQVQVEYAVPPTSINLNKSTVNMCIGDNISLVAKVSPIGATDTRVKWASSNSDIATVDDNGVVTAKVAGITTITAETVYGNYKSTCTVKVTKKNFENITFSDATYTYDGTEKSLAISGTLPDGADVDYTNAKGTNAGTYNATAKVTCDGYNDLTLKATLKINPAEISVTADNKQMIKNGTMPELTYTADKLFGDDKFEGKLATKADGKSVGTFDITQGTLTAGNNYKINFTKGTLTVSDKTPQEATVSTMPEKTYGDDGFTVEITNDQNSDLGNFTFASSNTDVAEIDENGNVTIKNAGDTNISVKRDGNDTYAPFENTQKLTVKKAAVTITAKDTFKKIGMDDPIFEYDVVGKLVGEDKVTGELSRQPGEEIGKYDIEQGTLAINDNYEITYNKGTFEILDKTPQNITMAGFDEKTYGDGAFTVMVKADETSKLDNFTYASDNEAVAAIDEKGEITIKGAGEANISATEAGNDEYAKTTVSQKLTVKKKALSIKVDDVNITYGDEITTSISYDGFIEGEDENVLAKPVAVGGYSAKPNAGEYDIVLSGAEAANYEISYTNAKLNVAKKDLEITELKVFDKAKDETTDAVINTSSLVFDAAILGDDVTIDLEKAKATFASAEIGENIAVTITDIVLSGADAANYNLKSETFATTANIKESIEAKDVAAQINGFSLVCDSATLKLPNVPAGYKIEIVSSDKEDVVKADGSVAPVENDTDVKLKFKIVNENDENDVAETGEITVKVPASTKVKVDVAAEEHGTVTGDGEYLKNKDVTVVATPDSGYNFNGWYNGDNLVSSNASYTFKAENDIALTAKFTQRVSTGGGGSSSSSYTVKFETNGGSKIDSVKVKKNETVAEPTAPTKDGFEFAGWYTDKDLTAKYDFSGKVAKSMTLYAAWTEKKAEDKKKDETTDGKNKFGDVKAEDWFFDNVNYVVENGLMNGVSAMEFAPNSNLTRAMLVTILYRAENEPETNKSIPFADVTADSYYANAVIWAQQNGIVSGITENEFAPDENITREQIAAIVYRYAKYKGYDTSATADLAAYADADEISEYAAEAMQYAVGSGLIKGKTATTLNPKDTATRAEIAAILQRFIEGNK